LELFGTLGTFAVSSCYTISERSGNIGEKHLMLFG
jgi:hypothetical protein